MQISIIKYLVMTNRIWGADSDAIFKDGQGR